MSRMPKTLRFRTSARRSPGRRGQAFVETMLILAIVAVLCIASMSSLGKQLHNPQLPTRITISNGVSMGAPNLDSSGVRLGLLDRINGALVRVLAALGF